MKSFVKFARIFDFLAAFGSLGWGIYSQSLWWGLGGALGLALAVYGPAERINRVAEKLLFKKAKKSNQSTAPVDLTPPVQRPEAAAKRVPPAIRNPRLSMYFVKPFPKCNDFSNLVGRHFASEGKTQ